MGVDLPSPMQMNSDNRAAIFIASKPVFHERTIHIEVDCQFKISSCKSILSLLM